MFGFRWLKRGVPFVVCYLGLFFFHVDTALAGGSDSKCEVETGEAIKSSIRPEARLGMVRFVVAARALEHLMGHADFERESSTAFFVRMRAFGLRLPELKELMNSIVEDLTGMAPPVFLGNEAEAFLWRLDAIFLRAAGQWNHGFDTRLFDHGYEAEVAVILDLLMHLREVLGDRFPGALEYHAATLHERYRVFNETLLDSDSLYRMTRFIVRNVREIGEALLDLLDCNLLLDVFNGVEAELNEQLRGEDHHEVRQFLAAQLQVVDAPINRLRGEVEDDFEPVLGEGDLGDDSLEDTVEDYWSALQDEPTEAGPGQENVQAYLDLALAQPEYFPAIMPWGFLNYGGPRPEPLPEIGPSQGVPAPFVLPSWSPYHPFFLPTPYILPTSHSQYAWWSYFVFSPQQMRWWN